MQRRVLKRVTGSEKKTAWSPLDMLKTRSGGLAAMMRSCSDVRTPKSLPVRM